MNKRLAIFYGCLFAIIGLIFFFGWRSNGYKSADEIRQECHNKGGVRIDGRCVRVTVIE